MNLCPGTAMTLPPERPPLGDEAVRPLVLLDGVLRAEPLLRLRDQTVESLAKQPGAACWQDALEALDEALAELRAVRARAGLRSADGPSVPPHGGVDQRVADHTVAARRRFSPSAG